MPLPTPEFPGDLRDQIYKRIESAAANDPDPVVRKRCQEVVALLRRPLWKQLVMDQRTIFNNPLSSQADRLRAVDIVFSLISRA